MFKRPFALPLLIAVCAALLAMFFSLEIYPALREPLSANIDPDRLGDLSSNLASGLGFVYTSHGRLEPAFDRGPVYPAVVAGIIIVTGSRSFVPVQLFQSILHGATCFLVFLIAVRLMARRAALIAECLAAIHPMLLWYTPRVWIETTHTFLVTLALLLLMMLWERPSPSRGIAAGAAIGITALAKSVILPFAAVAALLLIIDGGRKYLPAAGALLVTAFLLVVPWSIRNYAESGRLIPVHTSLGLNRVQGDAIAHNWIAMPFSTLEIWWRGKADIDSVLAPTGEEAVSPAGDRTLSRASVAYSLSHPLFAVWRTVVNGLTFCYLSESRAKSLFLAVVEIPLMICAFAGARRLWRTVPLARICALLLAYFFVVHMLIVGWARYSVPIVPVALVLAAALLPLARKEGSPDA
ncbi:MAG TPA: glycosyltransferase family 39 protein [Bacteroidota bacterium]|nr:glycosyltransferase family 39 protein [Bacteroidota bacterium]